MKKFEWKAFFTSLFARNVLICFFINVINNYGNAMKNAVRSMIAAQDVGIDGTTLGVCLSLFTFAALVVRLPSGSVVDAFRDKLKKVLAIYMAIRAVIWALFGIVTSPLAYEVVFTLDGAINAFIATALPAFLALNVDRRAMGSAYAIFTGMSTVITGTARSAGLTLYQSSGRLAIMMLCVGFALAAGVLCLCIDSKKMLEIKTPAPKEKAKGLLALYSGGIHLKLLPLCLISAIPVLAFTAQNSYSQIWLADAGFEHMTIDSVGGSISGIIVIAVGFLCDFVPPAILALITLVGYSVFPIMMGVCTTQGMYSAALWIFYLTKFYHIPLRIVGMKCVTKAEQGSFSSTTLLAYDIIAVIGSPILGKLFDAYGFQGMMVRVGLFGFVGVIGYIIMELTVLPKIRARSKEIEEQERAEQAAVKA